MNVDDFIGKQIGAYIIQHKLGEGGMARVYKATHARLHRDVAIKIISTHIADDEAFQTRFEREAQLIASLEHPNIVAVYDFGEDKHITYLAMQYISGGTLRAQLKTGQPFDYRKTALYIIQMAQALHHAHQKGIVHRDVKPQNMLIWKHNSDQLMLSDFGIAKLFDSSYDFTHTPDLQALNQPYQPALTSVDQIVGTAEYMAPEQARRQPIDARTDVYALGIVLYQMLTGSVPFQASTMLGLMYQHVHTPPVPVLQRNPQAPAELAAIAEKAMAKAPEERFQSAEAMAQAIAAILPPQYRTLTNISSGAVAGLSPYSTVHSAVQTGSPGSVAGNTSMAHTLPSLSNAQSGITHAEQDVHTALSAYPIQTRKKNRPARRWQTITATLLIIALFALAAWRIPVLLGWNFSTLTGQQATDDNPAKTFTENFTSANPRSWQNETAPDYKTSISADGYKLTALDGNTHFPYARKAGKVTGSFELSARMQLTQGNDQTVYGLTFYVTPGANKSVAGYAFVVKPDGTFALLKYTPGQSPQQLQTGSNEAIKDLQKLHTLRVRVDSNNIQLFFNTTALLPQNTTLTDNQYPSGFIGLLIGGNQAQVTVKQVKLNVL